MLYLIEYEIPAMGGRGLVRCEEHADSTLTETMAKVLPLELAAHRRDDLRRTLIFVAEAADMDALRHGFGPMYDPRGRVGVIT